MTSRKPRGGRSLARHLRRTRALKSARHHGGGSAQLIRESLQFEHLEHRLLLAISDPLVNVPGITSFSNPPDTVMDVGSNHVIQMVNATSFQIWDKHGNSLAGPTTFSDLWIDNPHITEDEDNLCASRDRGDPIVVYDHLADRWVLSQFFYDTKDGEDIVGNVGMCVAVSQTADPVSGVDGIAANGDEWYLYGFDTAEFPDYPKFGVWPDAYYISTNESNLGIYAYERAKMLAGDPTVGVVRTDINELGAPGVRSTRILPADLDGPAPPPGTPGYFARTVDDQQDTGDARDRIEIYSATPDFVGGTIAFNLIEDIDVGDGLAAFDIMTCDRNGEDIRDCIPQPNTIDTIDALSNRPMMQLKFRDFGTHFSMVFNQTVDVQHVVDDETGHTPGDEVAGIRWYELRSTDLGTNWGVEQQGDFADQPFDLDNDDEILHRWMGSAAMDGAGNIAIGYNIVNSDDADPVYPGINYTGRRFDDAVNTLPQGEKVILAGTTFAGNNDGDVNPQRWGDYSAISVDPVDDCTFWYTAHVAGGDTQIASFRFDTCVPPDPFEPNDTLADTGVLGSLPNITLSNMSIDGEADIDFYKYTAHDTGMVLIKALTATEHNLELRIWDRFGNVIASEIVGTEVLAGLKEYAVALPVVSQQQYFVQIVASSEQFFTYDVEIENFAAPVPNALWLDPMDDTGLSNRDNITAEDEARIFVEVDLAEFAAQGIDILSPTEVAANEPGAAVVVLVNGTEVGVATPIPGTASTMYQYTLEPGELSTTFIPALGGGGLNPVKAAVRIFDPQDPQSNGRGEESGALMLILDQSAPSPSVPMLLESSDSGDRTDGVTHRVSPAFTGVAEENTQVRLYAIEAGAVPDLTAAWPIGEGVATGIHASGGLGTWEITSEPLSDGIYDIFVVVIDASGNASDVSAETPVQRVEIDTLAPNLPFLDLLEASDTGRHDDDNITNDNTPALSMTSEDRTADPNAYAHLNSDNFIYRIFDRFEATAETLLYDSFAAFGDYVDVEQISITSPALSDGIHNLKLEVEDRAGNISYDFLLDVLIDTAAYLGDGNLHPESDSGVFGYAATHQDQITNDTTPMFFGVAEANNLVYVSIDGVPAATTVAVPLDGDDGFQPTGEFVEGNWQALTNLNLIDGVHEVVFTFEDVAGNQELAEPLLIFVDTQGPRLFNDPDDPFGAIHITADDPGTPSDERAYDMFRQKGELGQPQPTPRIDSLTIHVEDLPPRVAAFLYEALFEAVAENPGHYQLVGDFNGIIAIDSVDVVNAPPVAAEAATATIVLNFAEPLPDDRYTLIISDALLDLAGNQLDGETNALEPQALPLIPTGDGVPGGGFAGRFTVDSRPEIGVTASTRIYLDINGNFTYDPAGDGDTTNQDLIFRFGIESDAYFAGNFAAAAALQATGFDKLGDFGFDPFSGLYRFLLDFDHNGVADLYSPVVGLTNSGLPVAGDFAPAHPGDEIGLFMGDRWHLDTNGDNVIDLNVDTTIFTNMRGIPAVGDVNGDGADDLIVLDAGQDIFFFDLNRDGMVNDSLAFGLPDFLERPAIGDLNLDGVDDIGFWVAGSDQKIGEGKAEWHFLISDRTPVPDGLPMPSTLFDPFSPDPLGNDLFANFGDRYSLPIFGNFDPPVVGEGTQPGVHLLDYHNDTLPLDVNNDGYVSPIDALFVISQLNDPGPQVVPEMMVQYDVSPPYWDVNNDHMLSPIDALIVISMLNSGEGEGEGAGVESAVSSISTATTSGIASRALLTAALKPPAVPVADDRAGIAFDASASFVRGGTADAPPAGQIPGELQAWMVSEPVGQALAAGNLEDVNNPEELLDLLSEDVADHWTHILRR